MNSFALLMTIAAIVSVTTATTNIRKCANSRKPAEDDVNIQRCERAPCILKRKTESLIEFKFRPEHDTTQLTNTVFARIAGLPLPFVGVDNTDACNLIYKPSGEKAGCPLKAGEEYIYKNSIKVLAIYPTISADVHWALTGQGKRDIFCIELPTKIIA